MELDSLVENVIAKQQMDNYRTAGAYLAERLENAPTEDLRLISYRIQCMIDTEKKRTLYLAQIVECLFPEIMAGA